MFFVPCFLTFVRKNIWVQAAAAVDAIKILWVFKMETSFSFLNTFFHFNKCVLRGNPPV